MKNKTHQINFRNLGSLVKKEIQGYLDNPSSYVVLVVFLLIWFFIFLRSAFVIGEASLASLFNMFPWFGMVLIAAITMGSIAKEKDDGTLEFVLTHPVREVDFILSKLLSALSFVLFGVLFTLPMAIIFSKFGIFDWGVYASQVIGVVLLSSALISLGMFLSSLFSSQVASLLATIAAGFILILSGSDIITMSMPFSLASIFEQISLLTHYESIIRGVLDFYDILYFGVFIASFTLLTLLQLYKRKFGDYKARYSLLQVIAISLLVFGFIASSLKVWLPLRLDITQDRIYTLSPQTKKVLKSLQDPVTITLYASEQLPSQYAPILRDIKYILGDYKSVAGNKLVIVNKDPSKNQADETEASTKGVQKVQFNVIGQEELQLKTGYLGIVVTYKNSDESIPFINATNDLEYQLTSLINKLSSTNKPQVAFLNAGGSYNTAQYSYLSGELQKQFTVSTVQINKDTPTFNENINTLIIAGGGQALDAYQLAAIKEYLSKGHNLIVLADGYNVSNNLTATANGSNINEILGSLGISINKDVVFDLASYSRLSFRDGNRTLVASYPYWIISEITKANPIGFRYVGSATTFWPSSLTINEETAKIAGYTAKSLLTTTDNAGSDSNPPSVLAPSQQYPSGNKGKKVLSAILEPIKENTSGGRIAVIGDADMFLDALIQRDPENLSFGVGVVAWASRVDSLAEIQVKTSGYSLLKFRSAVEPAQIRFGLIGMIFALPIFVAFIRLTRRRALHYQKYV